MKPIKLKKMPLAKKTDRKNEIDNWAAPKYLAEVEYRDITTMVYCVTSPFAACTNRSRLRNRWWLSSSKHPQCSSCGHFPEAIDRCV